MKKAEINTPEQDLYTTLKNANLDRSWATEDLGEEMTLVNKSLFGWWKPIFVMDHRNKTAFRFLDSSMCLAFATTDDIDWESLEGVDKEAHERAEELDAQFPTLIRSYKNGVAQVSWQLNPDGRYYMDEDGFGMTDDEELEIYGYIDRTGKVLVKFKHVRENWDEVQRMREKAEKLAEQQ